MKIAVIAALATLLAGPVALQAKLASCGAAPAVAGIITPAANPPGTVYLGDYVTLAVCHLDVFLADAESREEKVTLYVDGVDTGNLATAVDHDSGRITFTLDRTEENKELWRLRLYDPLFEPNESIAISVGKAGDRPLMKAAGANIRVTLRKIYIDSFTWIWLALIVAIVVAIVLYARRSDMLRNGPTIGGVPQPYSLAKTQMAWWFLLTVVAFMFIWLITGDQDSLPPSLLGLLGISAATAVAAVVVSGGNRGESLRAILEGQITSIDTSVARIDADLVSTAQRITEAQAAGGPVATLQDVQAALTKARAEQEAMRGRVVVQMAGITAIVASDGLWQDLVRDDLGAVALDRLQIVVWTIVLGGVFIWTVLWTLTMPVFNATMLALMGISSGTYIGFKLPQRS